MQFQQKNQSNANSGSRSHRNEIVQRTPEQTNNFVAYADKNKVNKKKTMLDEEQAVKNQRYANQCTNNDYFYGEERLQEAEDVESSKGSAWPSETSRLTPLQSTYPP